MTIPASWLEDMPPRDPGPAVQKLIHQQRGYWAVVPVRPAVSFQRKDVAK